MKATYLKPTTEEILLSSQPIMIGASADGKKILEDGGGTSSSGITEGDSRRNYSVWDDEGEDF